MITFVSIKQHVFKLKTVNSDNLLQQHQEHVYKNVKQDTI